MSLIERLRRSYVDHGTNYVQEAADALELAYEMLDHLCIGAVECKEEIERLTAELTTSRYWREQEVKDLTAERDAMKAALQLIKANTNTLDWPDDINAAIQGAGK